MHPYTLHLGRLKKVGCSPAVDDHPVIHGNPRGLKTQGLDELVLIYADLLQPDVGDRPFGNLVVCDDPGLHAFSDVVDLSDDPGLHAISDVVDFSDACTETVP